MRPVSNQKDTQMNRSFGLVMAGGLGALAVIRYVWSGAFAWWLIGLGLVFLLAGLLMPAWLAPVRQVWMKLAAVLGVVNSRILLTLVYIGLVTPFAVLLRLLGKQPIPTETSKAVSSYWRDRRPEEFTSRRMERQF